MLAGGHPAVSIAERLRLPRTNLIYKWRDRFKHLLAAIASIVRRQLFVPFSDN